MTMPHASNANFGANIAHTIRWRRSSATNAVLTRRPTFCIRLYPRHARASAD